MDPNTGDTVQVAEYVSELFPVFSVEQSNAAAAQYAGLGTNLFQVEAIMGECEYTCSSACYHRRESTFWAQLTAIFICPTYFLLRAFGNQAYKVGVSLSTPLFLSTFIQFFKCEYAVPPALHGIELFLHFPGYQPFPAPNTASKSDPSWEFWNSATQIPLRSPSKHG